MTIGKIQKTKPISRHSTEDIIVQITYVAKEGSLETSSSRKEALANKCDVRSPIPCKLAWWQGALTTLEIFLKEKEKKKKRRRKEPF